MTVSAEVSDALPSKENLRTDTTENVLTMSIDLIRLVGSFGKGLEVNEVTETSLRLNFEENYLNGIKAMRV